MELVLSSMCSKSSFESNLERSNFMRVMEGFNENRNFTLSLQHISYLILQKEGNDENFHLLQSLQFLKRIMKMRSWKRLERIFESFLIVDLQVKECKIKKFKLKKSQQRSLLSKFRDKCLGIQRSLIKLHSFNQRTLSKTNDTIF